MFINLTNHPSEHWGEEQLAAAHRFGEIVDIPFPVIEPTYTKDDILRLVEEYAKRINGMKADHIVVHVMGEMTFTYNMVKTLKESCIKCVASTTERLVNLMPNGTKVSEFMFVQFREY